MTLVPEHTLTRAEIDAILLHSTERVNPSEEMHDWTIEELAEEAQNPTPYDRKDEYLRAIAYHPRGNHILVQLALASNEQLPSDVAELLIHVSPYATVVETIITTHLVDENMVKRAREAIESIHALAAR